MQPDVVLLDEPLANLDVHLRASMQDTFRDFHRQSGQTMVYITHDQAEAMALADRVAVMDRGRLRQVASPEVLYHRPATPTVARFVGTSTVVPASIVGAPTARGRTVDLLGVPAQVRAEATAPKQGPAQVMVRPNDLELGGDGAEEGLSVRVRRRIYGGGHVLFRLIHEPSGTTFTLPAPESSRLSEGEPASVRVCGGWLIPYPDPDPV
jgi:iron(III) transport system ATP-binding protein